MKKNLLHQRCRICLMVDNRAVFSLISMGKFINLIRHVCKTFSVLKLTEKRSASNFCNASQLTTFPEFSTEKLCRRRNVIYYSTLMLTLRSYANTVSSIEYLTQDNLFSLYNFFFCRKSTFSISTSQHFN